MDEFRELLQTNPWAMLLIGYVFTISIETPVLLIGLSPEHSLKRRFGLLGSWMGSWRSRRSVTFGS